MRVFLVTSAILGILAAQVGLTQGKPQATPSIEGVWKGTSTVTTGANVSANPNRQPNILIYTKGYYSLISENAGAVPRPPRAVLAPPRDANKLTDAEKLT